MYIWYDRSKCASFELNNLIYTQNSVKKIPLIFFIQFTTDIFSLPVSDVLRNMLLHFVGLVIVF